MNEKQLSAAQIQELHKLAERNAIKYYDVELEIVDHYASAIEAIWAENPNVSFDEAQKQIYKEFWDFKSLQKKKEQVLHRLAQKEINLKIRAAFSWPKIITFFLLTILFYSIGIQIPYKAGLALAASLAVILIGYVLYKLYLIKRLESQLNKRFLRLKTIALQHNSMILLLTIPLGLFESLPMPLVIFSACLAFASIFIFVSVQILQNELSRFEKQFS